MTAERQTSRKRAKLPTADPGAARGSTPRARLEAAILLLATGATLQAAASEAHVDPKRLRDALRQPEWARSLEDATEAARQGMLRTARSRMEVASAAAVDTLISICQSGEDDHARVKAAMALLDRVGLHGRTELRLGVGTLEQLSDADLLRLSTEAEATLRSVVEARPVPSQLEDGSGAGGGARELKEGGPELDTPLEGEGG